MMLCRIVSETANIVQQRRCTDDETIRVLLLGNMQSELIYPFYMLPAMSGVVKLCETPLHPLINVSFYLCFSGCCLHGCWNPSPFTLLCYSFSFTSEKSPRWVMSYNAWLLILDVGIIA